MNRSAWGDIKSVRAARLDAREDFVIGGGADHGGIITAEFRRGEVNGDILILELLCGFGTEELISADSAGEDEIFDIRVMIESELELF